MSANPAEEKLLSLSYEDLRKIVGWLGLGLPVGVSLLGWLFFKTGLQYSISHYYYTDMRNVFVGTLWVIGFFLFSYQAYGRADRIAGILGGIFGVGVSLFPTAPTAAQCPPPPETLPIAAGCPPTPEAYAIAQTIGYIHLAFATLFFATLICFSLFLFTRTDRTKEPTKGKQKRNIVYIVCGCIMLVSNLFSLFFSLPGQAQSPIQTYHPVFWSEGLAICAFGFSWITKGNAIALLMVPEDRKKGASKAAGPR